MLTVTNAALEHLHSALARAGAAEACFRFTPTDSDSVGLVVQAPDADDDTFEYDGDTVLAAPQPLAALLSRKVLDIDDEGHLILLPQVSPS